MSAELVKKQGGSGRKIQESRHSISMKEITVVGKSLHFTPTVTSDKPDSCFLNKSFEVQLQRDIL